MKNTLRISGLLLAGICAAFPGVCSAQTNTGNLMAQCGALLKPTQVALSSNKYAQLAELRTQQSSSHDSSSTNGNVDVMSYFSGTYGSQQEADRQLSTYDSLQWSTNDYLGYIAAYVPREAYAPYNTCVDRVLALSGVHLEVEPGNSTPIIIKLHFVGTVGATRPFHIKITGTNIDKRLIDLPRVPASGFEQRYTFNRLDKSKAVTLVANVVGGPAIPPGDQLTIPPHWVTISDVSLDTRHVGSPGPVICSGNNRGAPVEGPEYGPPAPLLGEEFVPSATAVNVTGRGSWDNNQFLSNPPFSRINVNTPQSIRAVTICMPNNPNSEAWIATEISYQVKTTHYRTMVGD